MRVGVCGGGFGNTFVPFFAAHPEVSGLAFADVDPARRREMAAAHPSATVCATLDELCADPDVDAIAVFTPPWLHAEHTLQALHAGKHVICAVPAALTLEELGAVVEEVERSGLVYMNAETSTYYPSFLYCRARYRQGDFGRFVLGDAENLYHPNHYDFYARDFYANFPPLLYATHTVAMIVGVTGSRLTRVAATGFAGLHPAMHGHRRLAAYEDNELSVESGLFVSDDGGSCRVTEGRWVGTRGGTDVTFNLHGTDGSFEEQIGRQVWSSAEPEETEELTGYLGMYERRPPEQPYSPVLPARDLPLLDAIARAAAGPRPIEYAMALSRGLLVDDFVRACTSGRRFFSDVWQAARFCAPGIVAHDSVRRHGEWIEIPDFGSHPDGPWAPDELDRAVDPALSTESGAR